MNYFLQDVVDFKLIISLNESGDKLDIYIEDEK
jgi:hypothetical protein